MSDIPPEFAERDRKAKEAARQAADEERMHFRNLMDSKSGRWLLRQLLTKSHQFSRPKRYGNNMDYTQQGMHDLVHETITGPIIRHFGHAPFDTILKG